MPRYDEIYERSGRYDKPSRWRPYSRWHRYSARTGTQNAPARYQTTERFLPRERYLPSERYLPRDRFLERGGYADDFGEYLPMGAVGESQERMGMHDFSERYGRYSGGSPYSYEYSERTSYHRPRFYGPVGFSQPLEDGGREGERAPLRKQT